METFDAFTDEKQDIIEIRHFLPTEGNSEL